MRVGEIKLTAAHLKLAPDNAQQVLKQVLQGIHNRLHHLRRLLPVGRSRLGRGGAEERQRCDVALNCCLLRVKVREIVCALCHQRHVLLLHKTSSF